MVGTLHISDSPTPFGDGRGLCESPEKRESKTETVTDGEAEEEENDRFSVELTDPDPQPPRSPDHPMEMLLSKGRGKCKSSIYRASRRVLHPLHPSTQKAR